MGCWAGAKGSSKAKEVAKIAKAETVLVTEFVAGPLITRGASWRANRSASSVSQDL